MTSYFKKKFVSTLFLIFFLSLSLTSCETYSDMKSNKLIITNPAPEMLSQSIEYLKKSGCIVRKVEKYTENENVLIIYFDETEESLKKLREKM